MTERYQVNQATGTGGDQIGLGTMAAELIEANDHPSA